MVPAININKVITILIYGVEKSAIPSFHVEKPPVDRVENEWQTASKTGIPPIMRSIISVSVRSK